MAIQRRDVTDMMISGGVVPVFNHPDSEIAKMVVMECYEAGLRVFEWTNRGDHAHKIFEGVREFADKECPGLKMGVGSILDPEIAQVFTDKGADFIVSPVFDPDLARFAEDLQIAFVPGCGSVTEIHQAQKYGARLVKLFPGNVLGPEFVKAVLGPMPWTQIMPTGGVSPNRDNLEAWFNAGVACVGMGSQLFKKNLLNEAGMPELQKTLQATLTTIKELRK